MNIDDRLVRSDPARTLDVSDDSLARMLRAVSSDAATAAAPVVAPTPARLRRRAAWIVGGLVAALALGIASPAIAGGVRFLAQTGWFGSPNPPGVGLPFDPSTSTEQDSSEWVDVKAVDFVDFAVTIYPSYAVLPPEVDQPDFARDVATWIANPVFMDPADDTGSMLLQTTNIIGTYELSARCTWMLEWKAAPPGSERATAAATVLAESAHWPATVSTDGGGIVDYYVVLANAALSGDGSLLDQDLKVNCPDLTATAGR